MKKIIYLFVFVLLVALSACKPKVEDKFTIEVAQENVSMQATETSTLEYTVKNNGEVVEKEVLITANDPSIVSIEGNTITALAEGYTSINISLVDKPSVNVYVNYTISSSLVILTSTNDLFVRDELTLTYNDAADKDDKGVTFTSSNNNVATVSPDGVVKGVSKGSVTITVTSKTNSVFATIVFTVREAAVNSITIGDLPSEIGVLDEFSVNATITPSIALQEVIWESSDPTIATVDEFGHVKVMKVGEVTITATSKIDETKRATVTFESTVDPIELMTNLHVENPIRQYVTTYGYNPDERYQWVNGSVSLYFNADLNLDVRIIPVDQNKYTGTYASEEMIVEAENLLKVRSGILHPETKYIIFHDTGNHNPGADAEMHHTYMQGADNRNNRARSWHYTVDENKVIQHIPDNEVTWQGDSFDAYAYGIGVETAVNFGSDLFTTWHRTAKLMGGFMDTYNIGLDGIKQHYDADIPLPDGTGTWKKDCPRTLRNANLYDFAIEMVYAEYLVRTLLADYEISFKSLNPEYVDDRGRVINSPLTATRVGYVVNVKGDDYDESTVLYSTLPGLDGTTTVSLVGDNDDIVASSTVDLLVGTLPNTIAKADSDKLSAARNAYDALTSTQKMLTVSYELLVEKELELHSLDKINTQVLISQILLNDNSLAKYGYIELFNPTNEDVNLNGWTLQYAKENDPFSIDLSKENISWIKFNANDVIKAKGYYLIQIDEASGDLHLPLANFVSKINLSSSGKIALVNNSNLVTNPTNDNVVDFFAYGDVSVSEASPYLGDLDTAIIRWGLIDTNNNSKDFIPGDVSPTNASRDGINPNLTGEALNAYEVDTLINSLPRVLVLSDESLVIEARNNYNSLTANEKALVKLLELLEEKEIEILGLKDPNAAAIFSLIQQIPSKINDDYVLPTADGITITYKEGQDQSYFNLETGTYLKAAYEYKPITLVATKETLSIDFVINFGILENDQIGVFNTGSAVPAAGEKTSEGKGTPQEQLAKTGFGGVTITIDNKVYFVGYKSYIELNKPATGTTLTMAQLRPHGSSSDGSAVYNQSLVKGVPTGYSGDGVLYYNASDVALTLNPSDTYGRNNASFAGYGKVVFSKNDYGTYTVQTKWADSGTNTEPGNNVQTLQPGEYLYCPHTYSTHYSGGTWLMQEGTGGAVGVLSPGTELTIGHYKIFE